MNQKSNSDFTILTINSEAKWKAQRIAADSPLADPLLIRKDGLTLRSFFEYAFDRVIGKPEGIVKPTDLAVDRCGILFILNLDGEKSRMAMYDPQQDRLEWIECIGGVGDLPTQFNTPKAIAVTDRTLYVADTGNRRVIAFARLNWQVRWIIEGVDTLGSPPELFASLPELAPLIEPCDLAVDADENLYVLDCFSKVVYKVDAGGRFIMTKKDAGGHFIMTIGEGVFERPVTIAVDSTSQGDIPCLLLYIKEGITLANHVNEVIQLITSTYKKMSEEDKETLAQLLSNSSATTFEEQIKWLESQLLQQNKDVLDLTGQRIAPLIEKYQTILYVLDAHSKQVFKFDKNGAFIDVSVNFITEAPKFPNLDLELVDPFGLGLDRDGNIYIGDSRRLDVNDEDNRFIYKFDPEGNFQRPPITAYRGRTDGLVADRNYNLYVLNGEREDITVLKPQERVPSSGAYISTAFDSTIPDCRWHKLVVEAAIREKTQIRISYFISEVPIPDTDIKALPNDTWSKPPLLNPQDALILSPIAGRYLWLRIELAGDGRLAPVVRSVQVYFQRISYLRYLPAVYQEDEASRDFLERFLSLFETFFYNLEVKIGQIARFFDPLATPEAFLPWLAQWLAMAFDENWPLEKQREFLRRAATLYKARGTRRGFEEVIELFTGEEPIIFEFFQLRCIQDSELRKVYEQLFGDDPFHFCVLLKPGQVRSEREYFAVKRIVDTDKPAHTAAGVRPLQPWIYLDMHTYLEINTYLQKPEMRLEQQSVIGRDSVLTDIDEAGQVERRSRVSIDTILT